MKQLHRFFHSDAGGGIILMTAAVLAMIAANSDMAPAYRDFTGAATLAVNDFLMAIFFLFAGLEIKRELVVGALSTRAKAMLPLVAAICGMAVPAAIFLFTTRDAPQFHHGWAIPSATDIAFALGVLALVSSRIPAAIKVLLMAVAVMDDLGAIVVIAFFYTDAVAANGLGVAALATACLVLLNQRNVRIYAPYMVAGLILWAALLKAGIHPTIGGVILGFCIPVGMIKKLEHAIKPYVVFAILPLFAFANAGVSLAGMDFLDLSHPVTIGIALGLFIGKPIGIFGSIWALVKFRLCALPKGVRWNHVLGLSLLCGIGFTMALFIGGLAFDGPSMDAYVRMGVMGGSILSAILGYTVLRIR